MKDLETLINQLALLKPLVGARDVGRLIQLSETFREQLRACVANYAAMYTSLQMIEYDEDGQLEDVTDERTPERSSIATEQLSTVLSRNAGILADMIAIKQRFTSTVPITFPIPQLPYTHPTLPYPPGTTIVLTDFGTVMPTGGSSLASFYFYSSAFVTITFRLLDPLIVVSPFGNENFVAGAVNPPILIGRIDTSNNETPDPQQTHVLFTFDVSTKTYYAVTGVLNALNFNFTVRANFSQSADASYTTTTDLIYRVFRSAVPAANIPTNLTFIRPYDWARDNLLIMQYLPIIPQSLELNTNILVPSSDIAITDCTRVFRDVVAQLISLCGGLNPLTAEQMDLLEWS